MGGSGEGEVVRYRSTVARTAGVLYALVLALIALPVAVTANGAVAATSYAVLALGLLGIYVMFLRPAVVARADHLLLRGKLSDIEVPWHLVEDLNVRQHMTKVVVGSSSYYGTGPGSRFLGVGLRERGREPVLRSDPGLPAHPMQNRLLDLAHERADRSHGEPSRQQVVRRRSLPLTVAFAALAVTFAVLVVVIRL